MYTIHTYVCICIMCIHTHNMCMYNTHFEETAYVLTLLQQRCWIWDNFFGSVFGMAF